MRVLGVITARGGSKGVPRKNVRSIAGKPLICWTFDQIRRVSCLDKVVVSTEDKEIKEISLAEGVKVVDRPSELAQDHSSSEDAILHALSTVEQQDGISYDIVVILEPTSPLRRPETIQKCVEKLLTDAEIESVMTVKESREHAGELIDGVFAPFEKNAPRRRQLRKPFYIESSTVYATRVDYLKKHKTIVANPWHAVVVDEGETVDINTENDFNTAESILKIKFENE